MNVYWLGYVYAFSVFKGNLGRIPFPTENDRFRRMDTCPLAVDKTVETVNNILYMQIYQKKLTNYIAGSIIVSESSKCWGNIC